MGERYKAKTEGKGTREITSEGGRSDITAMGGMTALHFAAREGHLAVVRALVAGGANVNKVQRRRRAEPDRAGHRQRPPRHRRVPARARRRPEPAGQDGVGPLWATVDARWPERTWYPPASITEEKTTHLAAAAGAARPRAPIPNARIVRKPWYRTFHGDWADPVGATPFWLAAKANDVEAMRLLVAARRQSAASRRRRGVTAAAGGRRLRLRAAGDQLQRPSARLAAVQYLVEELNPTSTPATTRATRRSTARR